MLEWEKEKEKVTLSCKQRRSMRKLLGVGTQFPLGGTSPRESKLVDSDHLLATPAGPSGILQSLSPFCWLFYTS